MCCHAALYDSRWNQRQNKNKDECFYSVQKRLLTKSISRQLKDTIYKIIILSVVLDMKLVLDTEGWP